MKTARIALLAIVALALAPSAAAAGWTPNGITVKATTSTISKVSATTDGAHGAFVVFQEETSPGTGVLRAQHVLGTGDLDPAWPAVGVQVSNVTAGRPAVAAMADGLGGAFVWWKEGATIYLTRFGADGAIAAGWNARGRMLGMTTPATALPSVIDDGAHGVYVAWPLPISGTSDPVSVVAIHIGPANNAAGGWTGLRLVAGGDPVATSDYWPSLALAPDGGVFVGWARFSSDPGTVSSAYLVRRMTAAGLNAAGWAPEGIELAPFHGEWLDASPETGLMGISADGRGGVFALAGLLIDYNGYQPTVETHLYRLDENGATASGWPSGGAVMPNGPMWWADVGPEASYRVQPNGLDGAHTYVPYYYDHGTSYGLCSASPTGGFDSWFDAQGAIVGQEVVEKGDGGAFLANFGPKGPSGPYQGSAYLSVEQTNAPAGWQDFMEFHAEPVITWYGDIGLASTNDGGVIFFWSQVHDQFGLFARRFNGAGEVTGVPTVYPVPVELALERLRFAPGHGITAEIVLPDDRGARLDLFDLAGRRVSSNRLDGYGTGQRVVTLPSTADLASGLYFARLTAAGDRRIGKVSIAR